MRTNRRDEVRGDLAVPYPEYEDRNAPIGPSLQLGMRYGQMPDAALVSRFEETVMPGLESYDDFARGTLKDRSPDPVTLESDQPKTDTSRASVLNLRYNNGRGEFNDPSHAEMFLEHTDKDPRGINVDPDFRNVRTQMNDRVKFVRMSADSNHSIHQGAPDDGTMWRKARTLTQQALKPRMRIFTTAKEGRREGKRMDSRRQKTAVDITAQTHNDRFVEQLVDTAMTKQGKTAALSNRIVQTTRLYSLNTTDHEFKVAKYGAADRRAKMFRAAKSTVDKAAIDSDLNNGEDINRAYKAAGALMGAIVAQRRQAKIDGVLQEHMKASVVAKSKALTTDLAVIMRQIATDHEMTKSEETQARSSAAMKRRQHLVGLVGLDHETMHVLNAALIYSGVREAKDLTAIRKNIQTDAAVDPNAESVQAAKSAARLSQKPGARNNIVEVDGKSLTPAVFKRGRAKVSAAHKALDYDQTAEESSATQNRRRGVDSAVMTNADSHEFDTDKQFYNNKSLTRLIGKVSGDKFGMSRHTRRDHTLADDDFIQ